MASSASESSRARASLRLAPIERARSRFVCAQQQVAAHARQGIRLRHVAPSLWCPDAMGGATRGTPSPQSLQAAPAASTARRRAALPYQSNHYGETCRGARRAALPPKSRVVGAAAPSQMFVPAKPFVVASRVRRLPNAGHERPGHAGLRQTPRLTWCRLPKTGCVGGGGLRFQGAGHPQHAAAWARRRRGSAARGRTGSIANVRMPPLLCAHAKAADPHPGGVSRSLAPSAPRSLGGREAVKPSRSRAPVFNTATPTAQRSPTAVDLVHGHNSLTPEPCPLRLHPGTASRRHPSATI